MSCEGDLTSNDVEASSSLSSHTLSRVAGGGSTSVNLFPWIHQDHCHGTNIAPGDPSSSSSAAATAPAETSSTSLTSRVLRAHDSRNATDSTNSITSIDEDSGILITVAFSDIVRIKQILITSATGDERIDRCRVWVNRIDPPSLEEAEEGVPKPDQEFQLLENESDCVEYPVRVARFSSVSNVTVFLSCSRPATQRLFYLGFKGESRAYKKEEGDDITVAAQNAADSVVPRLKEKYGTPHQTIR